MNRSAIILIGPKGTGKSTQGNFLSKHLCIPHIFLDKECWTYYSEIQLVKKINAIIRKEHKDNHFKKNIRAYAHSLFSKIKQEYGEEEGYKFLEILNFYSVKRVLEDYNDCVIDFGAAHSIYDNKGIFNKVQNLLAPYRNIVLLLPSPNVEESVRILEERIIKRIKKRSMEESLGISRLLLANQANYALSKFTVYTKGKTPLETRNEILRLLEKNLTHWNYFNKNLGI